MSADRPIDRIRRRAGVPRPTTNGAPPKPVGQSPPVLAFRQMDRVKAEPVDWLWPGRVPRGMVVLIEGDPSLGKSQIAIDIAARLSTGSAFTRSSRRPSRSCSPRTASSIPPSRG